MSNSYKPKPVKVKRQEAAVSQSPMSKTPKRMNFGKGRGPVDFAGGKPETGRKAETPKMFNVLRPQDVSGLKSVPKVKNTSPRSRSVLR